MWVKINPIKWIMFVSFALPTIKSEDMPQLTIISQKDCESKYCTTCVVSGNNTNSAIIWNAPLSSEEDAISNYVSDFVPARNNSYKCNIDVIKNKPCNKFWKKKLWSRQRSIYSKLGPVRDRRWEEFKTYYTSNSSELIEFRNGNNPNFTVHISIRIKEEAYIYLCDDDYPSQKNCYEILLQGHKNQESVITRCTNVTMTDNRIITNKEKCQKVSGIVPLNGYSYKTILNDTEWRHFTIEKGTNNILVREIENNLILQHNTAEQQQRLFDIKCLIIKSIETPGIWKLHDYVYTSTNVETTTILGPNIEVTEKNFCIALFVAMCSQCNLKLEIIDNATKIIETVRIKPIQGWQWQEKKIVLSPPYFPINIQLRVQSKCPTGNCENQFWAIDDFQICSEKEIRMLSIEQDKDKASCQLIKYSDWDVKQAEAQEYNLTVTSLTAYSKNGSSVSLRFLLPPYLSNREIGKYSITYRLRKNVHGDQCTQNKNESFSPQECRLWRNFYCVTLKELEYNQNYEIKIYEYNVRTSCHYYATIDVKTIQESPGILENLTYEWDNYYNLTLTWSHPSITNGALTEFEVVIKSNDDECHKKSFSISEENYNSTYVYMISLRTCYSSQLTITATAHNIHKGPSATQTTLSPPKTPSFSTEPSVEEITTTTITIKLPPPIDLEQNSTMYIIVSNTNTAPKVANNITLEIWNKLEVPNNTLSWIAAEYRLMKAEDVPTVFVVGDGNQSTSLNKKLHNEILDTTTSNYIISVLIINEFGSLERYKTCKIEANTTKASTTEANTVEASTIEASTNKASIFNNIQTEELNQSSNYGLFALLLLLLLPVIAWIFFRKRKEYKMTWLPKFNMNNNLDRNTSNPDLIPLTKRAEKQPGKIATQLQLRPKCQIPIYEYAELPQPSTSSTNKAFSKPVKVIEFEKYVKESIENGELERQHQLFPRGQTKPWDYALLPQNKLKNRYNNLLAYDHNSVKLTKINDDPYSDYINASYVEGYNTKKTYIATQGPKATTVKDFWRMIWQENVRHIVMVANVIEDGKKKNEQYWPNVNKHLQFGNIKVAYVSSRIFADYECRTFAVFSETVERRVEQLHFTSWPDHSVPLYSHSLVPFLRKILTIPQGNSPIVVHCSAGVGRTGTIILCDLCLRMAAREGVVDVLKHQYNLREQRVNLVDNTEQYKLAHLILLECLVAPQTNLSCDDEMGGEILRLLKSERVAQQMLYLHETTWQDQAMRPPLEAAPIPEWSTKNRFQDIIPWGYGHVKLSHYPVSDEHSDYINAVQVDGFRSPRRFIVTQQPLPQTKSDFWRMIDEKEITTIVSLNQIDSEDETSCVFWPTESDSEIQPVPFLTLQFQNNVDADHYSVVTIHLCKQQDEESNERIVRLIILKGWPAKNVLPDQEQSLLKLWGEIERVPEKSSRIVVTCYDGAKACGLFIALSIIIEKMKFEQECDVCSAVRTVRHNRKQFVTEIDQFSFLYRSAMQYLRCFDLYSNITPA